jgi:hypothetical protein
MVIYLDENGNPITRKLSTYLDESGNPIPQPENPNSSYPSSPLSQLPRDILATGKDVFTGAGKGFGSSVSNVVDLAKNIPGARNYLENDLALNFDKQAFEPENTAQSIGKAAEQVGEFVLPGGAVNRAAKFTEQAVSGLPLVAQQLVNMLTRSGYEGLAAGIINMFQGGDFSTGAEVGTGIPLAGRVLKTGLSGTKLPERMYQSALKPLTSNSITKNDKIIQTGLNEAIPLGREGLNAVEAKIGDLAKRVDDAIKTGKANNVMIDPLKVASFMRDAEDFFGTTVNGQNYISELKAIKNNFLDPYLVRDAKGAVIYKDFNKTPYTNKMPIAEAQQMKKNTYALLRKAYGELSSVSNEGQKSLAWGLKEQVADGLKTIFPELNNVNASEGALMELEAVLGRAVNRIMNKDMVGIGTTISATAGKSVTGSEGAAGVIAAIKSLIDKPEIKSKLAIALAAARKAGQNPSKLTPIALGLTPTDEEYQ